MTTKPKPHWATTPQGRAKMSEIMKARHKAKSKLELARQLIENKDKILAPDSIDLVPTLKPLDILDVLRSVRLLLEGNQYNMARWLIDEYFTRLGPTIFQHQHGEQTL